LRRGKREIERRTRRGPNFSFFAPLLEMYHEKYLKHTKPEMLVGSALLCSVEGIRERAVLVVRSTSLVGRVGLSLFLLSFLSVRVRERGKEEKSQSSSSEDQQQVVKRVKEEEEECYKRNSE